MTRRGTEDRQIDAGVAPRAVHAPAGEAARPTATAAAPPGRA